MHKKYLVAAFCFIQVIAGTSVCAGHSGDNNNVTVSQPQLDTTAGVEKEKKANENNTALFQNTAKTSQQIQENSTILKRGAATVNGQNVERYSPSVDSRTPE
jgi:hypothetical protein